MAKNIFTIEDVNEFLSQNNISWTGFIYNDETFHKKLATNKDFEHSSLALEIENVHARNSITDFLINHFNFVIYTDSSKFMENGSFPCVDKNLSKNWQKFLLNEYQSTYAELLLAWSTNNLLIIKSQIDKNDYSLREQEVIQTKLEEFEKNSKLAMNYLQPTIAK